MSYELPEGYRFLESHEWASHQGETIRVGISDFAQDELGDVVYVELPSPETHLADGETFGVIESIKAVSDLYTPVSGTVTAVNDELLDRPELVNEDPYGDGWMIELTPDTPEGVEHLLSTEEYAAQIG